MAIAIRPLDRAVAQAWDAFVVAHPDGTFFHRAAWATIIERAFGHRTFYVYAERDGAITGVLPLAQVKTRVFGNTLISVPFCVYGGPLTLDRETAAALSAHASSLLERTGAGAVEFRYREPCGGMHCPTTPTRPIVTAGILPASALQAAVIGSRTLLQEVARPDPQQAANAVRNTPSGVAPDGWVTRPDLYVTFRKQIEADHDQNLKAVPRKQRAMVRKGIQNGLRSVVGRDVRPLHEVYAESVRNLGTPVFSRRYFALLADVFAADCDVVTVLDADKPIAAVMNFYFRDEVLPYYGGGTTFARHRAGNDFMYWEVMRRAADRGCRLFDFGRSKLGTGAFDFKKNWGFVPEHLSYRYKLAPGASIPDHNPLNPKYRYFVAVWKRLPLPIANAIGPSVVRGLG